ncbi:hypothetical protein BHYA_0247g00160 [Botrytis hyacinthi]|uniref:Uncharacterized protein n=1 Tax=Botrytis hyacinthi TaxID=278943 RepID=A0A4Z1G8Z3_9HELO|nr:hypothetical protein BHYA_0247g00160 [Botrytis hyacinthi]
MEDEEDVVEVLEDTDNIDELELGDTSTERVVEVNLDLEKVIGESGIRVELDLEDVDIEVEVEVEVAIVVDLVIVIGASLTRLYVWELEEVDLVLVSEERVIERPVLEVL